jgi:hypothetical protein
VPDLTLTPRPGTKLRALDADLYGPVKVTGGYGGWTEQPRPGRVAVLDFEGQSPITLTLTLLFDRHGAAGHLEPTLRQLENMARVPSTGGQPATLALSSTNPHLVPHSGPGRWYVITALEWGDEIRTEDHGAHPG